VDFDLMVALLLVVIVVVEDDLDWEVAFCFRDGRQLLVAGLAFDQV